VYGENAAFPSRFLVSKKAFFVFASSANINYCRYGAFYGGVREVSELTGWVPNYRVVGRLIEELWIKTFV